MPQGKGTYGSKVGRPPKRVKKSAGSKVKNKEKKLTKRQEETLKKHSEHHSAKHMKMMRKEMREGSTFTAAHKKAQKAVGK